MKHLLMIMAALAGMTLAADAAGTSTVPFAVGEKLYYRIFWGPLPVGEACLEVRGLETIDGHECYHIVVKGSTSGLGRALFPVDSYTESWLDKKELFSRQFKQDHREGRHTRQATTQFDYVKKEAITTNLKNGREKRMALAGPVQDVISALYYARTRPLAVDQAQQFVVNANEVNYDVNFRPDQRREISVRPVGDVPALRIEPTPTLKIVSANGGRLWFWISDDARHLPLVFNSTISFGTAKMVLYKMELPGIRQYTAAPAVPTTD